MQAFLKFILKFVYLLKQFTIFTIFTMFYYFQVYTHTHIYIYIYIYFRFFSPIGYYKILSTFPCAIQQVSDGYLFIIQQCVYIRAFFVVHLVKKIPLQCWRPGLIPGLERFPGEGIGYPLQYSWASLVAQMVKNLPAMWWT